MNKCFERHKPKIKTLLHVFDHTVKPILTYGSEVWDTFDPQTREIIIFQNYVMT